MSEQSAPSAPGVLSRIMRVLSYVAATAVIVLALLVGIARLLLPVVPEYRAEIRRWAEQATGYSIEFERISASWPISGPELSLYGVTVSDGADAVMNVASFRIGASLFRMLRDRQLTPSRVVIEGTRLDVERDPQGLVLIQGRPLDDLLRLDENRGRSLPELDIELSDIELTYTEIARDADAVPLRVEQLEIDLAPDIVRAEGELQLDERYGGSVSLAIDLPVSLLAAADQTAPKNALPWQVYVSGEELNLARLATLAPGTPLPLRSGRGDVTLWADFAGRRPANVTLEGRLEEVLVVDRDDIEYPYPSLSGRGEWQRRADGWLVSGSDLAIQRGDNDRKRMEFTVETVSAKNSNGATVRALADRVPLDELFPLFDVFAPETLRERLPVKELRGEVLDVEFDYTPRPGADAQFDVTMRLEGFGLEHEPTGQSVSGISAELSADQAGGRLEIDSGRSRVTLPAIFSDSLAMDSVAGFLVWRVTESQIRVLSDNIDVSTPYAEASARFQLDVPRDGGSPVIDLAGVARADDASQTVRYLPLEKFPPQIVKWIRRAVGGGRMLNADIAVAGPLAEFPFRTRDEGLFRIVVDMQDATLDFADDWPVVENLVGRVVFEGVSIVSDQSTGTIGGLPFTGAVRIPDLATGILEVESDGTFGFADSIAFLRATPVAAELGPVLDEITGDGEMRADFSLTLPVARAQDFELAIDVEALGNRIGLEGLNFDLTDVRGAWRIRNFEVSGKGLSAQLLDEPVQIDIRPAAPDDIAHSHVATLAGTTPAKKWMETLSLPFVEHIDGSLPWRAIALIPARKRAPEARLHILVDSTLDGLVIDLPEPLAKSADVTKPITLDIGFVEEGRLDLTGEVLDELSWALRLRRADQAWQIERMAVHSGTDAVNMPANPGVELSGRFAYIDFNRWLDLTGDEPSPSWQELYKEATIAVDELAVFGMVFREVTVQAATGEIDWRINVEGPTVSGRLTVPLDVDGGRPLDLDMKKLHLIDSDESDDASADPRNLLAAVVAVEDFVIGDMRFGALETSISRVPDGVLINPIRTTAPSFAMEGEGAWLVQRADETRQRSRLRLAISSTDIEDTLTSLGYDAVILGEQANAALDLTWPGGPRKDFVDQSEGTFEIKMERGMLLEVDPGGGRLLGMLSVAALPRRLSLDFSDVLDEGLGFDVLQGKFQLTSGNAYTCNLSVEGSVTDLGIVGRTGLTAEDYQQFAVIRPHVSNVLPLGGVVVGGPGVGAAMWIFSQIFKKPLSTLGESYYRVSGSWDEPNFDRIQSDELDSTAFSNCEQYLAALQADLNQS